MESTRSERSRRAGTVEVTGWEAILDIVRSAGKVSSIHREPTKAGTGSSACETSTSETRPTEGGAIKGGLLLLEQSLLQSKLLLIQATEWGGMTVKKED